MGMIEPLVRTARELPLKEAIDRFFDWWWQELRSFVPQSLRPSSRNVEVALLIQQDDDGLCCYELRANHRHRLGRIPPPEAAVSEVEAFRARIREPLAESGAARLVLAHSGVVHRRLTLPIAARGRLREVLAYEMDRQTPFRADQVYHGHRLVDVSRDSDELVVDLYAVPRTAVEPLLERIAARGIPIGSIEIADDSTSSSAPIGGLNLLPIERRARKSRPIANADWRAAQLTAALVAVALAIPLAKNVWTQSRLEAEIATVGASAQQLLARQEELRRRIATEQWLVRHKQSAPAVIDVLAELTRVLPDDTWLSTLDLRDDELRMRGQSRAASELIGLLEASPRFSGVVFVSPVVQDSRTGQERFEIRAAIVASS